MSDSKRCLPDGAYACRATLHIKGGKAVVMIHDAFGLEPGSTIPLLRTEGNLVVEADAGTIAKGLGVLNGHGII